MKQTSLRTLQTLKDLLNTLQRNRKMSTDPFDEINEQMLVDLLVEVEDLKDDLAKNTEYANLNETTPNFTEIKQIEQEMFGTKEKREKYKWFKGSI